MTSVAENNEPDRKTATAFAAAIQVGRLISAAEGKGGRWTAMPSVAEKNDPDRRTATAFAAAIQVGRLISAEEGKGGRWHCRGESEKGTETAATNTKESAPQPQFRDETETSNVHSLVLRKFSTLQLCVGDSFMMVVRQPSGGRSLLQARCLIRPQCLPCRRNPSRPKDSNSVWCGDSGRKFVFTTEGKSGRLHCYGET